MQKFMREHFVNRKSRFLVFYARYENFSLDTREILTEHVDYTEYKVGGRAVIGILIDSTLKKRCLKRAHSKIKELPDVYVTDAK